MVAAARQRGPACVAALRSTRKYGVLTSVDRRRMVVRQRDLEVRRWIVGTIEGLRNADEPLQRRPAQIVRAAVDGIAAAAPLHVPAAEPQILDQHADRVRDRAAIRAALIRGVLDLLVGGMGYAGAALPYRDRAGDRAHGPGPHDHADLRRDIR